MKSFKEILTEEVDVICDWCKSSNEKKYIHPVTFKKSDYNLCDDCYEELYMSGEKFTELKKIVGD